MSFSAERGQEMRTSAGFHANNPNVYVGGEAQQLHA